MTKFDEFIQKIACDCAFPTSDIQKIINYLDENDYLNVDLTFSTVPHDEIISAYHEILGDYCPRVLKWTKSRKKIFEARWKESKKRRNIEYWRGYFEYVSLSSLLTGKSTNFVANLEWIVTGSHFLDICEGKYHHKGTAKYGN